MSAEPPSDTAVSAVPHQPTELAAGFARVLRGTGVQVPLSSVIDFAEALEAVGLQGRDEVYWAGRATLAHSPVEIELYDRAFAAYWERWLQAAGLAEEQDSVTLAVDEADDADDADDDRETREPADEQTLQLRFSSTEVLRQKDFADYTDAELAEADRLISQLRLTGAPRRSRRRVPSRRLSQRPDLRRTIRSAMATGGEPIRLATTEQGMRSRRVVLLLDVSGSMEPYARALIRFAHAAVLARRRIEVFALGTRLTRVTKELSSKDPDRAVARAARAVMDYGGGTRLGEGIRSFLDGWGQRGTARGSIVVILSDGWDRGDPELLSAQMERLARLAHRVIWVNPLKVTPGYAPLARGMVAALPHVDEFVEGHSIDALETIAELVTKPDTAA